MLVCTLIEMSCYISAISLCCSMMHIVHAKTNIFYFSLVSFYTRLSIAFIQSVQWNNFNQFLYSITICIDKQRSNRIFIKKNSLHCTASHYCCIEKKWLLKTDFLFPLIENRPLYCFNQFVVI